jgi:type I restriction enzyme R subunit
MTHFTESEVEQSALTWLEQSGWQVCYAAESVPSASATGRADYTQVVLTDRLQSALETLNPNLPAEALADAMRRLLHPQGADLLARNRAVHRMLVDGVNVEYRTRSGDVRGVQVRVLNFDNPTENDFLAINQFTVVENKRTRRPDIVLFVNGLPLAVIELKNPADETATIETAFRQLQTYKKDISTLFQTNAVQVISDGVQARVGTLTADWEWYKPWRTVDGSRLAPSDELELKVMLEGVFTPEHLLLLLRDFVVFEVGREGALAKKMAGYHQFHAVQVAVGETIRAMEKHQVAEKRGGYMTQQQPGGKPGDRRIGVVWHTQGSGKSLTMVFYAGRIIREPAMHNPTLVVLTDRVDLDDQLFGTFSRCKDILRQVPVKAESRADLRKLLAVEAGGVVFTTIHKFFSDESAEPISNRSNIVVIADEAHRTQYDFIDGLARHMRDALPHASFIGFTGTPIEKADANTRAVFGDYISIYDIQRAVLDHATVPIYYESRLAKISLAESERPRIDPEFEEATEGEEVDRKEKLKSKWAALEAVVGAQRRIDQIAQDIVAHFEQRQAVMDGKGMIVCMSRRICVDLYNAIAALRPAWVSEDDDQGMLKVIMTGAATDPLEWQMHIRDKTARGKMADNFRNPKTGFKLAIVRDMWLTGFDVPSLHTMYLDKPMSGHGLMQTIARVNRVFKDKPGGLVVDYLGLAAELKKALQTYTESGGLGETAIDQQKAVHTMLLKYEICVGMLHGFNWSVWSTGNSEQRLRLLPPAQECILAQQDGKQRFSKAVQDLSLAYALAVPHEETARIRDDVSFFQALRAVLTKRVGDDARSEESLDFAVKQIIDAAVAPEGVMDVFSAAGLKQPDISILSDEFLEGVRDMPQKNLAVEVLRKLLEDQVKHRWKTNVVQARSFAEMLEKTIRQYQNRTIEAAAVIEELVGLAHEMKAAAARGEQLGLTDDELAFYDALALNDSAVMEMGDEALKLIARELVEKVRQNVTIDWRLRESVQSGLRVLVKRVLRRHHYPPDKQEKATELVLEQTAVLSEVWADE